MRAQVARIVRGSATLRRLSSQTLTHFRLRLRDSFLSAAPGQSFLPSAATRQYPTATYSVCDSAKQFRARAKPRRGCALSSLLRAFLCSVCGSATRFSPACPARKRSALAGCCISTFQTCALLCPPWYSRARVPHLLLLPLPPTLSGFRPHLPLLIAWFAGAVLSH